MQPLESEGFSESPWKGWIARKKVGCMGILMWPLKSDVR